MNETEVPLSRVILVVMRFERWKQMKRRARAVASLPLDTESIGGEAFERI